MSLTDTQIEAIRSLATNSTVWWVVGFSALLFAFAACRIFARAGFHASLGLLMLVPGINVVMMLLLAFAPWPVEKELRGLRKVGKKVERAHSTLTRAA